MKADSFDLPAGTDIGPYRLIRKLGYGRSATAYLAYRRPWPRHLVALKINQGPSVRTSVRDFEAEAALFRSQPIPGRMARWLESGKWHGHPWFATEWGTPVPRDLPIDAAHALVRHLAISLAILASKGLVHGDVKPSNIVMVDGQAVLIDFGCSVLQRRQVFDPKIGRLRWIRDELFGSQHYMAPELVFEGIAPSLHSDLYGLAASLVDIFSEETYAPFKSFVTIATYRDMTQRPQNILDWLAALDASVAEYKSRTEVLSPKDKFLVIARKSSRVAMIGLVATVTLWMLSAGVSWTFRTTAKYIAKIRPQDAVALRDEGIRYYNKGDITNAAIYLTPAFHLHDREAMRMMKKIWDETAPRCAGKSM